MALAALKVEAAELQQLIMVVELLYFWSSDLQKALFGYMYSVHLQEKKNKLSKQFHIKGHIDTCWKALVLHQTMTLKMVTASLQL